MSPAEALAERLVAVRYDVTDPEQRYAPWVVRVAGREVIRKPTELAARDAASDWRVALAFTLAECLPGGREGRDPPPDVLARARELARDLEGHASLRVPVALELAALAPRLLSALDAACRDRDAAEGALQDLLADEGRALLERGRAEEREACRRAFCILCEKGWPVRYDEEADAWLHPPNEHSPLVMSCGADAILSRGSTPEPTPPARLRARVQAMEGVLRRLVAWAEEDRADAEQWAGIGALADAAREALGEGGHAEP